MNSKINNKNKTRIGQHLRKTKLMKTHIHTKLNKGIEEREGNIRQIVSKHREEK